MADRLIKRGLIVCMAMILTALFVCPLRAETQSESGGPEYRQKLQKIITTKEEGEFRHELDSFLRYAPASSLEAQPGEIALIQAESEYSYNFKAYGKLPIELSVNSEYVNIIEKKSDLEMYLPPKLTGIGFGGQVTLPFFTLDKAYFRLKVIPSFFSDHWVFEAKDFRMPFQAFAIYQPQENLTFILGMAVYPQFEDKFLPIIGLIYEPNDKWSFDLVPSRPTISYNFNDYISVFTEVGFSGAEFRVSKAGERFAILSYDEKHAGAGIKVSPNKYIDICLSSGYMFGRRLQYRDSLGKAVLKNNLYSELRLDMKI